ncbi:hypothetical protein ABID56_002547 [Alkalibacillus flavidus]|uniref:Uncharacterized protein n=1 Tax=Alkalibacillus flavidus TaxID=546021 RepID=A0ABV2KXV1_9BACI
MPTYNREKIVKDSLNEKGNVVFWELYPKLPIKLKLKVANIIQHGTSFSKSYYRKSTRNYKNDEVLHERVFERYKNRRKKSKMKYGVKKTLENNGFHLGKAKLK